MKPLIIITGATATGKTDASLNLHLDLLERGIKSEIINFDSLIFYRELSIGTAKPSEQELEKCPHHLINCSTISSPLNSSDYRKLALPIIEQMHKDNIVPILVGGSGFYIRALIKGMYESSGPSEEALAEIENIKNADGLNGLREKLKQCDPESFESIHHNDEYRTTRALEHYLTHQTKISDLKKATDQNLPYDFSKPKEKDWKILNFYMSVEKDTHWKLMLKRVRQMIKLGLLEEVQDLLDRGFSLDQAPLQSIGYKETIAYLTQTEPEVDTIDKLIERIYINTRRLAKSQKTFFAKVEPKVTIDALSDNRSQILADTISFLDSIK